MSEMDDKLKEQGRNRGNPICAQAHSVEDCTPDEIIESE